MVKTKSKTKRPEPNPFFIWDLIDMMTPVMPCKEFVAAIRQDKTAEGAYKGVLVNWGLVEKEIVRSAADSEPCFGAHKIINYIINHKIDRVLTSEEIEEAHKLFCPPPRKFLARPPWLC